MTRGGVPRPPPGGGRPDVAGGAVPFAGGRPLPFPKPFSGVYKVGGLTLCGLCCLSLSQKRTFTATLGRPLHVMPIQIQIPPRRRWTLKALARRTRAAWVRVRHPKRVTCLDCGFLASGDEDEKVSGAIRSDLGAERMSTEGIWCSRNNWIELELGFGGSISEELQKDRRQC